MSDKKEKVVVSSGGIGFFGLLTITFIVLKLCGVIGWSWFWVLCPLYPPILLLMIALLIIVLSTIFG